jgi:hypothetical protein
MKRIAPSVLVVIVTAMVCHGIVTDPESMAAESNVADGLSMNEPEASAGYTLIFPMRSAVTYLVDNESRVVKQWKSRFTPAHSAHLMPNGNTLICSGAQGIVFEVTSEGKTVWQYKHPGVDQAGGPQPAGNPEQGAADGGLRIGGPGGLFRVYRYASDYPAFEGKTLTPGEKLADLAQATE